MAKIAIVPAWKQAKKTPDEMLAVINEKQDTIIKELADLRKLVEQLLNRSAKTNSQNRTISGVKVQFPNQRNRR